MNNTIKSMPLKVAVGLAYIIMVVVNALASVLPLNGVTPGQVSDSFPNLFAPAGLTFSIWGLIYLLLAAYTLYQFGLFQQDKGGGVKDKLFFRVGVLFALSSLVNAAWIFAWHYYNIILSLLLMLVLLIMLIKINLVLAGEELTARDRYLIKLPFSVYFGWITVATVANITVFLVYTGWNRFGMSEALWTVIIVSIGALIGLLTMIRIKCEAYGLVIIWAYIGIIIKHTSAAGFAGQYPAVIVTTAVCIAVLLLAEAYLIITGRKSKPFAG